MNPFIFREYDIRGVAGKDLTTTLVKNLGATFAAHTRDHLDDSSRRPIIVTGRDGRLSSPELGAALVQGLAEGGADVIDAGLTPSPGLYFATHLFEADAGVMLTGSHNPPDYNGMKMVRNGLSVYGEEIQAIKTRMEAGLPPVDKGSIREEAILERYLDRIVSDFRPGRPIKVVMDCGNGAAGAVAPALLERLSNVSGEVMFAEVDGTFPNHHPDPTLPETLETLRQRMKETGAEIGIGFDGDGDRIGALDENGNVIWGDRLMAIFGQQVLKANPGAMVIGDVKCSQVLFDEIARLGGKPDMWKTGHSLIKARIKETGALLAGEMSGHLFFKDRYLGFDDALYAAMRLIEVAASGEAPISSYLTHLPKVYSTPELRLFCADDVKFEVMDRIAQEQRDLGLGSDLSEIDGVRVRSSDGAWWLVRVSNTQPALVARVEAPTSERLHELVDQLGELLKKEGVEIPEWSEA